MLLPLPLICRTCPATSYVHNFSFVRSAAKEIVQNKASTLTICCARDKDHATNLDPRLVPSRRRALGISYLLLCRRPEGFLFMTPAPATGTSRRAFMKSPIMISPGSESYLDLEEFMCMVETASGRCYDLLAAWPSYYSSGIPSGPLCLGYMPFPGW